MSLFGFFDNEPKEESENKGIVCPSTGHVYKDWEDTNSTTPYSIGEQYGRKQLIVFPDLNDWLDLHASRHVKRAIETHANVETMWDKVDDIQKKWIYCLNKTGNWQNASSVWKNNNTR